MFFLPFLAPLLGGSLGKLLTIAASFLAEAALQIFSFVLYLAKEYWGRWVLAGFVVALALLYGRWHYIQVGRESEARFRAVLIDRALSERCQTLKKRSQRDNWLLPEGWPNG